MVTDPSSKTPGLSIFFPAYNDSGTIASLVIEARSAAQKLTGDFEIIVVNDGSADHTAEIPRPDDLVVSLHRLLAQGRLVGDESVRAAAEQRASRSTPVRRSY